MSREEIQSLISTNEVEKIMLNVRGQNVLLDRDVAMLYGVETKRVNEAVRKMQRNVSSSC
ncbi:MAG: ORF6N domain-containing protein [Bacteroidales bacterium]|nr:ORF6N domain-containing protein [Bacteroidales bacterium]